MVFLAFCNLEASPALGCGVNPVFSNFGSMEGVVEAVRTEARRLFNERVGTGFQLNPPFKGFGMAFLWFAMDRKATWIPT